MKIPSNVVTEGLCAAEELVFGLRHAVAKSQLLFDELNRADEIRDLKETISFGLDGLRELDAHSRKRK